MPRRNRKPTRRQPRRRRKVDAGLATADAMTSTPRSVTGGHHRQAKPRGGVGLKFRL